jgi:hypothetical protein
MEISPFHIDATAEPVAEMDRLGDEIAELSAQLAAATAHLLELIREFDARGGWNHGFRSCAKWLAWRVGMNPGAARERVRVARALGSLSLLADALAHGELSYSKVRALTRVATRETEERLLATVAGSATGGRAGPARRDRAPSGHRSRRSWLLPPEPAARRANSALQLLPQGVQADRGIVDVVSRRDFGTERLRDHFGAYWPGGPVSPPYDVPP